MDSSIVHYDSLNSCGHRNPERKGHHSFEFYRKPKRIQNNSFTTERERQERDKMAAVAAMRTTLTCLGFTQDVATMITNVQGGNSIDELKFLDDKGVEGLCNNIRKPGGMMPNPDAAAQGETAMICVGENALP